MIILNPNAFLKKDSFEINDFNIQILVCNFKLHERGLPRNNQALFKSIKCKTGISEFKSKRVEPRSGLALAKSKNLNSACKDLPQLASLKYTPGLLKIRKCTKFFNAYCCSSNIVINKSVKLNNRLY